MKPAKKRLGLPRKGTPEWDALMARRNREFKRVISTETPAMGWVTFNLECGHSCRILGVEQQGVRELRCFMCQIATKKSDQDSLTAHNRRSPCPTKKRPPTGSTS